MPILSKPSKRLPLTCAATPYALMESELILRSNQYLYEAEIRPVPAGDGQVDLEVETRDVWTLRGGVSFLLKLGTPSTPGPSSTRAR